MKRVNFMLNERDSHIVEAYIKLTGFKLNKVCYDLVVKYCKKMLARRLKRETRIKAKLETNIKIGQEVAISLQEERDATKTSRVPRKYNKKKPELKIEAKQE